MPKLSKLLSCFSLNCLRKASRGTAADDVYVLSKNAEPNNDTLICENLKSSESVGQCNFNPTCSVSINTPSGKESLNLQHGEFTSDAILSLLSNLCPILEKNCYLSLNGQAVGCEQAISVPFAGELTLCYKLCGGAGKKRKGERVHPGRVCSQCSYCGRKPADGRFAHSQSWDEESVLWLEHSELSLLPEDCLCRKCNTALLRKSRNDAGPTSKRVKKVFCQLHDLSKCCKEADHFTSIGDAESFSTCFDVNVNEEYSVVALCKAHYTIYYKYLNAVSCDACGSSIFKPDKPKRCARIGLLIETFKEYFPEYTVNSVVNESFFVCRKCYNFYYLLLKGRVSDDSYDNQLNDLLEELNVFKHPSEILPKKPIEKDLITVALKQTIIHVGSKLLNNNAILLAEAYEYYSEAVKKVCREAVNNLNARIDVSKCLQNKRWLFSSLIVDLEHHVVCNQLPSAKYGILLYRKGCNMVHALHHAMARFRLYSLKTESSITSLEARITTLVSSLRTPNILAQLENVGELLNGRLMRQVSQWLKEYSSTTVDLTTLNLEQLATEIDPVLWNFIFLLTCNGAELKKLHRQGDFDFEHQFLGFPTKDARYFRTRLDRRLFAICCLLFCVNDECNVLQLLFADVVDSHSGSSELLKVLNHFGMTVSRDTLTRFVVDKSEQLLLSLFKNEFTPGAFALSSIDNVDKGVPFAALKAGGQNHGFHGTTIQAVEPQPQTIKQSPDELVPCYRKNVSKLRPLKVQGDGRCFFRAIAIRNNKELLKCSRNESGLPVDARLDKLEVLLADVLRQATVDIMRTNLKYYLELDPAIIATLCEKQDGLFYSSFEQRIQLMANEDEYVGMPEMLAVVFAASCPVHVYLEPTPQTYICEHKFGEDSFGNVEPVRILYTPDQAGQPGHYNLLVDDELLANPSNLVENTASDEVFVNWKQHCAAAAGTSMSASEECSLTSLVRHYVSFQEVSQGEGKSEQHKCRRRHLANDTPLHSSLLGVATKISPPLVSPQVSSLTLQDFHLNTDETQTLKVWDKKLFLYVVQKLVNQNYSSERKILPTVKGYFSLLEEAVLEQSSVFYLQVLHQNADNPETIKNCLGILYDTYEIGRKLKYLVVVGDGKTFEHLVKLKDEYGSELGWLLPFPGDWHILKNYQPVIMKIYWDAGLKYVAKCCYKQQTLQQLGDCLKFRKTHLFLLQMWEAFYRAELDAFLSSLDKNQSENSNNSGFNWAVVVDSVNSVLNTWSLDPDDAVLARMKAAQQTFSQKILRLDDEFKKFVEKQCESDKTWKFWHDFTHINLQAYVLLWLAIRSGCWSLRLASLKLMAPLFHSFQSHTYLRLITRHLADVATLPHPIINHFKHGGFVVSVSGGHFSSVALDEAHEMLINKDVKCAILRVNQQHISRLTPYLPYRAKALKNIKKQVSTHASRSRELAVTVLKIEECNIFEFRKSIIVANVFSDCKNRQLLQLITNQKANDQQTRDLMSFREIGMQEFDQHVTRRILSLPSVNTPFRKRKLQTFKPLKTTVSKLKKVEKDRNLVMSCLKRQLAQCKKSDQPIAIFNQYIELPRAIACADGTLYKGSKANTTRILKVRYNEAFSESLPLDWFPEVVVLEGMFMINSFPLGQHRNFKDYAVFLTNKWIKPHLDSSSLKQIHIVFDDPLNDTPSLKQLERLRRDEGNSSTSTEELADLNEATTLPSNWRAYLASRANKRMLVHFLSSFFLKSLPGILKVNQVFVTAGGFSGSEKGQAMGCNSYGSVNCSKFASNHEESDSRVWFHALQSGCSNILIFSPDTDTYHVGLSLSGFSAKTVFVQLNGSLYDKSFVNLNKLCDCLLRDPDLGLLPPDQLTQVFQTLYIVSGCDYTSFFVGFGKARFYQTFFQLANFISGGRIVQGSLSEVKASGLSSGLLSFYRFVGCLYFKKYLNAFEVGCPVDSFQAVQGVSFGSLSHHIKWLDMIREVVWERVEFEDQLIPSNEALTFHWLRSCSVAHIWSQALIAKVFAPPYNEMGWKVVSGNLKVRWDTEANIAKVKANIAFLMKGCKCRGGCGDRRCGCFKQHQGCGPGCKCVSCSNVHNNTSGTCKGEKNKPCPRAIDTANMEDPFEDAVREISQEEQTSEDRRRKEEQDSELEQAVDGDGADDGADDGEAVVDSDQQLEDMFDESDLEDML